MAGAEARRRSLGLPILDLTVSNPTQADLPYPAEDLARALANPAMATYRPSPRGMLEARAAVAGDFQRRGADVAADHIVLTASSSESYALLFKLLADPGQAVLVPQPSYPLFDYLARLAGIVPRPYRLAFDGRWHIDFSSLDFDDAAAVVVVSPNNPTGSFISRPDCQRLAQLAADRGVPLIVDEVFADFPLAPGPDSVHAVIAERSPALVFSLGGLSKACGLPQLKLGWIAARGPEPWLAPALAGLDLVADTYLSAGTPVQVALPALLDIGATIRASIEARTKRNRAALAQRIGATSPCTLLPTEAGWSAILRVPAVLTDEEWALVLLQEDGVLLQPGYFFDLQMGATLVLSLLTPPSAFDAGIDCILGRASRV